MKHQSNTGKINTYLFTALLGVLVFILLYPKIPLLGVAGTYVAVRLEDILVSLILGIWFFLNFSRLKYLFSQTIMQALLLFWFIGLLSLLSSVFITYSTTPHLGFLHWLRRVEFMSLFIVAMTTISSRLQVKIFLGALFASTIIIVLYGFGQIYFNFPVISTTNREFSKGLILYLTNEARPNSTFAGHYDLAVFLSIVLVFIASLAFVYQKFWQRALIILSGVISFGLLSFTAARVSFAAVLAAIAYIFWLNGKKMMIGGLIIFGVIALVTIPQLRDRFMATINILVLEKSSPTYQPPQDPTLPPLSFQLESTRSATLSGSLQESLREVLKPTTKSATLAADIAPGEPTTYAELDVSRSFKIRWNVEWPRALMAFYKNPLIGTGYSSITIATDNDYLRSLGETGILGTLAMGLVFLIIVKQMMVSLKKQKDLERGYLIAVLCSLVVLLITATFIDVLESSKIAAFLWIILGIGWGISRDYRDAKEAKS